jgi:hypothetical protein
VSLAVLGLAIWSAGAPHIDPRTFAQDPTTVPADQRPVGGARAGESHHDTGDQRDVQGPPVSDSPMSRLQRCTGNLLVTALRPWPRILRDGSVQAGPWLPALIDSGGSTQRADR